ncbi:DUF1214 domain-containing protein [Lysobacter soli]|uniref:DUF1214 domain-containing protein n=1 Tax=Lysobacter soli TaxID=453783 RepID=UPI0037CB86E6
MPRVRWLAVAVAVALVPLTACNRTPAPEGAAETPPGTGTPATAPARSYTDQDISDAYIYLLSRLLVLRQQQLDLKEGFKWNEIVHRKPGAVDWPNPNLDVAYSEAWIAVDENSCTIVTVPKITGRYYTVQFLNGWGETLANINERTQRAHPNGEFAVCLKGANVQLPANATRIDLPVKYARVLARVELGDDWKGAEALQHQFAFKATGTPALPTLPTIPSFDMDKLPGVEAFEAAPAVLDSEADLNTGMDAVAAKARAIAEGIKDPAERARVDQVIREKALADFAKASPTIGHGTTKNHWARPAVSGNYKDDWLGRTLVNYAGIWANDMDEVVYYKGNLDATGTQLNGDHVYTLTFPKDDLPEKYANYFWSVIAVDTRHMRVLPNAKNRFLLNRESGLRYNPDGSLTLYFAADKPADAPDGNWLPTPRGQDYRLTFRFYGPKGGVKDGTYFPPPVVKRS